MKRPARAQICLPPLEPHEALRLVQCLEKAVAAIWRAHGHQMAELLVEPAADSRPKVVAEHPPDLPF